MRVGLCGMAQEHCKAVGMRVGPSPARTHSSSTEPLRSSASVPRLRTARRSPDTDCCPPEAAAASQLSSCASQWRPCLRQRCVTIVGACSPNAAIRARTRRSAVAVQLQSPPPSATKYAPRSKSASAPRRWSLANQRKVAADTETPNQTARVVLPRRGRGSTRCSSATAGREPDLEQGQPATKVVS
jgi:hypothetical protein